MSDLQTLFTQAQQDVTSLAERPDNATMLQLYALFKQASSGDATGERPGMMDFIARAKFDAWEKLKGITGDEAMQKYIDLVAELKA
ncbi:acyl-CoA-binding protein [Craterilacuibacter sp.]|uniref:acyl-CoA-binding protein n=1 Tax=Craterilacuibacter sp. TaxID=2870909 RepID=UPI003F2FE656